MATQTMYQSTRRAQNMAYPLITLMYQQHQRCATIASRYRNRCILARTKRSLSTSWQPTQPHFVIDYAPLSDAFAGASAVFPSIKSAAFSAIIITGA